MKHRLLYNFLQKLNPQKVNWQSLYSPSRLIIINKDGYMDEMKSGDKVILFRLNSLPENYMDKYTLEEIAGWQSTEYAVVTEVERGLNGLIHKVKTWNRSTKAYSRSWFWVEDTMLKAVKFEWKEDE